MVQYKVSCILLSPDLQVWPIWFLLGIWIGKKKEIKPYLYFFHRLNANSNICFTVTFQTVFTGSKFLHKIFSKGSSNISSQSVLAFPVVHFLLRCTNLSKSRVSFPIICIVKLAKIRVGTHEKFNTCKKKKKKKDWKFSTETSWDYTQNGVSKQQLIFKFQLFYFFGWWTFNLSILTLRLWEKLTWDLNLFWPVYNYTVCRQPICVCEPTYSNVRRYLCLDRVFHVYITTCKPNEPQHDKTCLRGLRPGQTQSGLLS